MCRAFTPPGILPLRFSPHCDPLRALDSPDGARGERAHPCCKRDDALGRGGGAGGGARERRGGGARGRGLGKERGGDAARSAAEAPGENARRRHGGVWDRSWDAKVGGCLRQREARARAWFFAVPRRGGGLGSSPSDEPPSTTSENTTLLFPRSRARSTASHPPILRVGPVSPLVLRSSPIPPLTPQFAPLNREPE